MSKTIKEIYDIAIAHMDEIDPQGDTINSNTRDYQNRTPGLITALYPEVYLYDSMYQAQLDAENRGEPGPGRDPFRGRPRYRRRPGAQIFTSMEDEVDLDDELTLTVLPYGLAAALLADENPTLANFLQARYEELLQKFETIGPRVRQPADWEPIGDVYGASLGFDDARW